MAFQLPKEQEDKCLIRYDNDVETIATDANLAAQALAEVAPLLDQIVSVMNKYRSKHGLNVGFSVQLDGYGRHKSMAIDVTRPL